MPREWDYIVDNNLMALEDENSDLLVRPGEHEPSARGWEEEATIAYYARTDSELTARRGRGVLFPDMALPRGLGYDPGAHATLEVPGESRSFAARYAHDGPKICILPAGSGPAAQYPGAGSWAAIIGALRGRFPSARFYLTGTRGSGRHRHLTTTRFHEGLLARVPDLLAGAAFLLDPATTYQDALARHQANIARARICHERMPEVLG